MEHLTPEQHNIIFMRVWDGLTFDEIATILHITVPAAKMRYQRGVATLGSLLTLLTLFFYANIT
jgi:DNA-directed RNA polymerase specialized sigma24 family protein